MPVITLVMRIPTWSALRPSAGSTPLGRMPVGPAASLCQVPRPPLRPCPRGGHTGRLTASSCPGLHCVIHTLEGSLGTGFPEGQRQECLFTNLETRLLTTDPGREPAELASTSSTYICI